MFGIPPLNSDVLAISFDGFATPSIKFNLPEHVHGRHAFGWGLGWYPGGRPSAMVAKDPAARGTQILADALTDWSSFRSTVFFCKVLGADKSYTHTEAQPFSRSFAGRDWLFMHNGDLDKQQLDLLHGRKKRLLEPVGKTDSELAFCNLLAHMQEEMTARQLSAVDPQILLSWFQSFDALGSADMCLSDGLSVACFHGTRSPKQLCYARIQPPESMEVQQSSAVQVALNDPRDTYRTALMFSTAQFSSTAWMPMQAGQLLIARRGALVWNSHPWNSQQRTTPVPRAPVPLDATIDATKAVAPFAASFMADANPSQSQQSQARPINVRAVTATPDGKPLAYRMFRITHASHYEYSVPVEHSTHLFRLQPTDDPVQEVVRSSLTLSSIAEEIQYEDVFGNQAIYCSIEKPYTKLSVEAESIVKVYAAPPDDHSLSRRQNSIPLVWMPWQRQMMMPYLLPKELPESQLRELTDYAMSFVERNDSHLLRTVEDINLSIYRDFAYRPGTTELGTTPFDVYTSRQGVCQDFANLFICLARLLSIPARYRMGYIYTGANYANKIQSDASHAWGEVYLPYVGWRGFDPTNGCAVAQDHIRVACGRNYGDATPTSGTIYRGGGAEKLSIDVKVVELQDSA